MFGKTTDHTDHTDKAPESDPIRAIGEIRGSFPGGRRPALVSVNQLAELVQGDQRFLEVAEIYTGSPGFSVPKLARELVESEFVPFLPFQRYKETGLRKRRDWEQTWELQRREDEVEGEVRSQK
jgi:hypothetical protein